MLEDKLDPGVMSAAVLVSSYNYGFFGGIYGVIKGIKEVGENPTISDYVMSMANNGGHYFLIGTGMGLGLGLFSAGLYMAAKRIKTQSIYTNKD